MRVRHCPVVGSRRDSDASVFNPSRYLMAFDGALLDQWPEVMHCKSRGEALRRLLDPDKPKIIFTNPDILFLILGLQYHAEPFEALDRKRGQAGFSMIWDGMLKQEGVEALKKERLCVKPHFKKEKGDRLTSIWRGSRVVDSA
ncbi:MAG: hypothetical protein HY695_24095 [Deltaproteobacteria bacterium]|nr:hypothetical protein [Deltaproteobacteria bacterium]